MEKLNDFLKKNVAEIALGIASIGLTAHTIIALTKYSKIVGVFAMIHLRDPLHFIMRRLHGFHNFRCLSFLFLIMLAVGGWHYKKSNGQDSRLLKFGFSILAVRGFLGLLMTPISYLSYQRLFQRGSSLSLIHISEPTRPY